MNTEPRSLLRKPGEPLVCYCPPGICQAPKGFSGPCNRAAAPSAAPLSEVELIEKAAVRVGMKSLMNHGAASCIYTEGCNGVSQAHLIAFAREVALHCVAALAQPAALQYAGPWCCEKGQAARVQVCDECAAESAGYSAAWAPEPDDTPLETGEGDARG